MQALVVLLSFTVQLQAQRTVLTDNYDTASNWFFLGSSSATTASAASGSTNPSIKNGVATITSNQSGIYGEESRIFRKISSSSGNGILGSSDWSIDFEFEKISSSKNSVNLLLISDSNNGLQSRVGSTVDFNNVNIIGVEVGGGGVIQLFQNQKGSTKSTYKFANASKSISDNTKYYGQLTRNGLAVSLYLFTDSKRTNSLFDSVSITLLSQFTIDLDYIVHGQSAGWGSSTSAFSVQLDSVSVTNNSTTTSNLVKASEVNVAYFPNPSKDFINIRTPFTSGFSYSVMNVNGQVLGVGNALNSELILDLANLPSGTYLIKGMYEERYFIIKAIKE